MATLDDLEKRVAAIEARPVRDGARAESTVKCTADLPHDGMMYNGELYQCRCGQVYEKAGKGKLREVVHVSVDG